MLPGPSRLAFQSRPKGATRRHSSSTAGSSRPRMLVMPLGSGQGRRLHGLAALRTTLSPDSKSMAPAKTRAVYSPRLSPAAPCAVGDDFGIAHLEAFERRQAGDEDRRLADVGRFQRIGGPFEAQPPQVESRGSRRPGRKGPGPRGARDRALAPSPRTGHPGRERERRSWA